MLATQRAAFAAGANKGLGHDLADGTGATATLGAASEAAIDLTGGPRGIFAGCHDASHVVVSQDITVANNHQGTARRPRKTTTFGRPFDKEPSPSRQKEKALFEAIPNCPGLLSWV
jgi:hypothetical protein